MILDKWVESEDGVVFSDNDDIAEPTYSIGPSGHDNSGEELTYH